MNVVYILTKLELGGAQKICLSLLKGINGLGGKTFLISGSEGVLASDVKKFDNVYLLDSFKREVGLKNIWSEIKTFFKIISYLKKLKSEHDDLIVHTHSTKAGVLGRWAAFFAGVQNRVHTVHGFGFNDEQTYFKWSIVYFLEFLSSFVTTKYICVSSADIKIGKKLLPGFKKKSLIIRAAVEWDKFFIPATTIKKEFFIFGTVSCFKPQKNLLDLLKAFKIISEKTNKKILLQIIGDGVMRPQIELYIKKHCLNVELLGWQNDVSIWMKTWDAYVMSSLWEGLPCSIVEARLLKLPVIAYDVGGISDVIFSNKNGYLIPPKKVFLLAEKMQSVLDNSSLHKAMKDYNDELSEFNDQFMVKKHFEIYRTLF